MKEKKNKMNFKNGKKFCIVFIIILIVEFNLILADDNSDSSENEENGQIGTFRSGPEYVIEEIGSKLNNGNSTSFIGKTFSKILDLFADKINLIVPGK